MPRDIDSQGNEAFNTSDGAKKVSVVGSLANVELDEQNRLKVVTDLEVSTITATDVGLSGITFSPGGKNLFNIDTITPNCTINTTGTLNTSGQYYHSVSDYIPVNASSVITANAMRFIAEYNSSKVFVAGTYVNPGSDIDYTFTTNANTAFIRVCIANSRLIGAQVEYGSIMTTYEAYYKAPHISDIKFLDSLSATNSERIKVSGYSKVADREKYEVWTSKFSHRRVMAIYKDIAVQVTNITAASDATYPPKIMVSTTGINGKYDSVVAFNSTNFPGLIATSTISKVLLLPWTRTTTYPITAQRAELWRMLVITDKGQIYHNYPARSATGDGSDASDQLDIIRFDESVIWDLPNTERKFPTTVNPPADTSSERYFPGLPTANYEHHPILNTDGGFVDTYGNGGFGKSTTVSSVVYPRFYIPSRANHPFAWMGGYEPGIKLTLIGTYRASSTGGFLPRICVFASHDGGRQWFCQYEFASNDTIQYYGNAINTSALVGDYTASLYTIKKRALVLPDGTTKEPATKFTWTALTNPITSMTKASTCVVTCTAHGLVSGNVIAVQGTPGTSTDWDWMLNTTVSTTSGGNGMLFRVKYLTADTFELYEYTASVNNNIPCRHIHHINRVKDGWLVGTGEEYPEGWVIFFQQKRADAYELAYATTAYSNIIRLNSANTSIQRTLGTIFNDDADGTIIVASDSAILTRSNVTMPNGRTATLARNSTGIFKGKLVDVDDFTQFTSICETEDAVMYLKEKLGVLTFVGQEGEFGISFDQGTTWDKNRFTGAPDSFAGMSTNHILIGAGSSGTNYIIVLK